MKLRTHMHHNFTVCHKHLGSWWRIVAYSNKDTHFLLLSTVLHMIRDERHNVIVQQEFMWFYIFHDFPPSINGARGHTCCSNIF